MALKLAFTHPEHGAEAPNAYHRIERGVFDRVNMELVVRTYVNADQAALATPGSGVRPFFFRMYTYAADEAQTREQAYAYLKTLADFEGAVDA